MSDFKFTDDAEPLLPPAPPPPGPAKKSDEPAKPTGFQFTEGSNPVPSIPSPQVPIGPAPPVIGPAPPVIGPAPPVIGPAPPVVAPTSPTAAKPAAATPPAAIPPAGPRPLQPRQIGQPLPTPQAQAQAPGAGAQRPAGKPAPIPIPAIALPIEMTPERPAEEREGAPQDNFSYKIWSVGQTLKSGLDALEGPASMILRAALVVGVLALAYILAATMTGKAGNLAGNPNAAALVKNLTMSSQAFMVCLLLAGVSTLVLGYEDNRLGFLVGGVGVLCHFVVPVLLKKFVGDSQATAAMAPIFRHYGYFMVMIGLIKGLLDIGAWLWNLPEAMKQKHAAVGVSNQAEAKQRIIAREANMLSPCWRLPFCRESIRKQCPAFLARSTCWKFGRGCYCDEEMISRIVRGEALETIKAPTRQSRQGKAPCGRCYIYLEHQTYKFRVLSPLALPAAVLSTYLVWPFYVKAFTIGDKAFNSIWTTLSFKSVSRPDALETSKDSINQIAALGNSPAEVAHIAQNMLGVLLGFMLLIYISKFIEWAIFKAKW